MAGRLVRAHGLDAFHLRGIRELAAACDTAEGLVMRLNWRMLEQRPHEQVNDLLYYDGEQLVGFLGLYQFTFDEAEATAMTHPAYRRQGLFKQLLRAAEDVLCERQVRSMLFFVDRRSPAAKAVARATGARFDHSEYLMVAQREAVQLSAPRPDVELRPGEQSDLPYLAWLDEEGFGVQAGGNTWLERVLVDTAQKLWVVTLDGKAIGKIHGRAAETENHIFGFVIDRAYRGRGYGRAALSEAMRRLRAERDQAFTLEVMTDNERALGLYQNHGFAVVSAYDYYRRLLSC